MTIAAVHYLSMNVKNGRITLPTVTVDSSASFPFTSLAASTAYTIDWGDGGATTAATTNGSGAVTKTHTYTTPGSYTLRMTNDATGVVSVEEYVTVNPTPPVNTVAPTVTGTHTTGQTLTVVDGTWTGIPTPTLTYQWVRADDDTGTNVANISGQTASTYVLAGGDTGKYVSCKVTATNVAGSANATAAYGAVIATDEN